MLFMVAADTKESECRRAMKARSAFRLESVRDYVVAKNVRAREFLNSITARHVTTNAAAAICVSWAAN